MTNKQCEITSIRVRDRAHAESLLVEIQEKSIELMETKSAYATAQAEIDRKYGMPRDCIDGTIAILVEALENWAVLNPAEFGEKRTIQTDAGIMGHRLGNFSLRLLGKKSWDKVLETLSNADGLRKFIRVREEVDREMLISHRNDLGPSVLRAIGVRVEQKDRFFVEPNLGGTK